MAETTENCTATFAGTCVAILALALLAGCATVITAETAVSGVESAVEPSVESEVCDADTDTFCTENDQQQAARFYQLGLEFAAKEDYDQALLSFEQAIEMDSANPVYHYSLGVTYHYLGMADEEESAYMEVLEIEPDDPKTNSVLSDTYFNLACLYALQGKKDEAFLQLEKLSSIADLRSMYHDVQSDKDLDSLRDDPRYKELMSQKVGDSGDSAGTSKSGEMDESKGLGKSETPIK